MAAPALVKAAPPLVRIPGQSKYKALQDSAVEKLDSLARQVTAGLMTPREWYDQFSNSLLDLHTDAWVLGRQRSGDTSERDEFDDLAGRALMDQESAWLLNFYNDLENGRYGDPGEMSEAAVTARSRLYAGKLRGSANRAFVESSDAEAEFDWVLGGVEKHCSDCPELADMSPWRKDELGWTPGEGGTPCLTNCKCHMERTDGSTGFRPVPLFED